MPIRLRERRRQMLRDEILSAAQSLLAARGYAALSMEELAGRAGISKPTLYAHFPAKEDVVASLAGRVLDDIMGGVEPADSAASPLERLVVLLQAIVRAQIERSAGAMQLQMPEIVAILASRPELRERAARLDQLVIALVRAAGDAGELDPAVDLPSAARIFSALTCVPHVGRLSAAGDPDPEVLVAAVGALLRRGLAAPPAGAAP